MAKRILLVSQNFYPEFFKSNDIASELVARGYKVDVLTGIPNYPEGIFPKGYGVFQKRVDKYKGAKVYRAFQIPRGRKASSVRLAINYLSFVFTSTFWVLFFFVFKERYDSIIIHQTSPITQAWPGLLLGKLRRVPIYTWVLDIWPDSVLSTINSESQLIKKPLDWLTDWVYRSSHKILISSPGFRDLVNRNANYGDKIIDFPNWSDDIASIPVKPIPPMPEGFIIMMAGNIADGQGVSDIVKAIELLKDYHDIHWVFVGGGAMQPWLKEYAKNHNLEHIVHVVGRYPFECMSAFYKSADVMLLTLKRSICSHLNATIPARVQSYLSAGKPIVGMAGEGVQSLINGYACGIIAESGEYMGLSQNILKLYNNRGVCTEMGAISRKLYEQKYTVGVCMGNLDKIITGL